jgi:hypothetical protein
MLEHRSQGYAFFYKDYATIFHQTSEVKNKYSSAEERAEFEKILKAEVPLQADDSPEIKISKISQFFNSKARTSPRSAL